MRRTVVLCIVTALVSAGIGQCQVLQNGQFVEPYNYVDSNTRVADKWTHFRVSQNPQFKQSDFEQMPGGPGGQVSCQQIWANWSSFDAGVYQRITGATVGQTYRLKGWLLSIYRHGYVAIPPEPYQDGNIYQRIGVDPYGGTNPGSSNVIWSWDDPLDRRWRELCVDFQAQSSAITVFARTNCLYAKENCLSFYDAFDLSTANPVVISNVSIRPGSTSATVTWTTNVPSDSKVNYVKFRGPDKNMSSHSSSTLTTQHSVELLGLSQLTQYYVKVESSASGRDTGVEGGHTFTTMKGQEFDSLQEAKNNPDGLVVHVKDLVVSAGASQFTHAFAAQEQDRTAGILVDKGFLQAAIGDIVDVSGTLATSEGQRKLTAASLHKVSSGPFPPALAVCNAGVGGSALDSYNPGVTGGIGPNNGGVLITVWGRITAVDATGKCFYVDDGSGLLDGTSPGRTGVRVSYYNTIGSFSPVLGSYAVVTGVSSCFQDSGSTLPLVLLRSAWDLVQL